MTVRPAALTPRAEASPIRTRSGFGTSASQGVGVATHTSRPSQAGRTERGGPAPPRGAQGARLAATGQPARPEPAAGDRAAALPASAGGHAHAGDGHRART